MLEHRKQMVIDRVRQLTAKYKARHPNHSVPEYIEIRFDLRGRAAGMAGRAWNFYMRFNRDMMTNDSWDHLFNNTVPHELAHIICFANGTDRGHGRAWRATCIELGGTGETYHKEAVTYAKGRTYVYTTSTGRTINISETKHRRIQSGVSYTGRNGLGSINKGCAYSLLGSTDVVKPTAAPIAAKTPAPVEKKTTGKVSNAELIRRKIRQYRADVGSEAFNLVLKYAVDELGMKAGLARSYIKNNWDK